MAFSKWLVFKHRTKEITGDIDLSNYIIGKLDIDEKEVETISSYMNELIKYGGIPYGINMEFLIKTIRNTFKSTHIPAYIVSLFSVMVGEFVLLSLILLQKIGYIIGFTRLTFISDKVDNSYKKFKFGVSLNLYISRTYSHTTSIIGLVVFIIFIPVFVIKDIIDFIRMFIYVEKIKYTRFSMEDL